MIGLYTAEYHSLLITPKCCCSVSCVKHGQLDLRARNIASVCPSSKSGHQRVAHFELFEDCAEAVTLSVGGQGDALGRTNP